MIKVQIVEVGVMGFDWKITAQKVAVSAVIVILSGLLAVYQNNPAWLAAIPIIQGLLNVVKHWND